MITIEILDKWKFLHYIGTPDTIWMREIYCGMYVSYDFKEKCFRLMPSHRNNFLGIILPFTTIQDVVLMVLAMKGDWCD